HADVFATIIHQAAAVLCRATASTRLAIVIGLTSSPPSDRGKYNLKKPACFKALNDVLERRRLFSSSLTFWLMIGPISMAAAISSSANAGVCGLASVSMHKCFTGNDERLRFQ